MVDREMDEWWGGGWNGNLNMGSKIHDGKARNRTILDLPRGDGDDAQMELTWTRFTTRTRSTQRRLRSCVGLQQRKQCLQEVKTMFYHWIRWQAEARPLQNLLGGLNEVTVELMLRKITWTQRERNACEWNLLWLWECIFVCMYLSYCITQPLPLHI